jgi:RNA polymerase sigma-70 factor (ECF subfamily)
VSLPPTAPQSSQPVDHARWFAEEVHAHDAQLKSYLRGSFRSVRDVEDVVQESYLRIWKAGAAQPIQSAKAFLFKIARHLAFDDIRKRQANRIESVGDLTAFSVIEEGPTAVEQLTYNEKVAHLSDALASLPTRCRRIVMLRKIKGLSIKEVAAELQLSERTVENQLARGMKRCEKFLRSRGITSLFADEG